METGKIGFLDPGFAGLAILRSVVERLPLHDYVYFSCGVQNQAPAKGLEFLFSQGCDVIVVPNVRFFPHVQALISKDTFCIGVAEPVAEMAVAKTRNNHVGIISRNDTKCAEFFAAEIRTYNPAIQIYQQACPMLVPLIEAGGAHRTQTIMAVLRGYMEPLIRGKIDVLVLGNAHYNLIKAIVQHVVGKQIFVVDIGTAVAAKLADDLARNPALEKKLTKRSQRSFFSVTENKKTLDAMSHEFYGSAITVTEITV